MAVIDLTLGGTTGYSENAIRKMIVFKNTVDFSGTHLVNGIATANALTAADEAALIAVPAGFFMVGLGVRLDTVQGAVATCSFGDGTDPNGWIDTPFDLDGTPLDTSFSLGVSDPYPLLGGKLYHVADTIDLEADHVVDAAVVTAFAWGFIV